MLIIYAPHFVAAHTEEATAPIIKYMRGWNVEQILQYCNSKDWKVLMQIKVKEVTLEKVVKGKARYEIAHVTYEFNGEARTFKVFSFKNPQVFKDIQEVQPNETIEVDVTKGADGYNQWAQISRGGSQAPASTAVTNVSNKVVGSNYETREERAIRQVAIAKQSSLDRAIDYFELTNNHEVSREEVVETAQFFTDWVTGNDTPAVDSED